MTRHLTIALISLGALLLLSGCGGVPTSSSASTGAGGIIDAIDAESKDPIAVEAVVILGGVRGVIPVNDSVVLRDVPFGTEDPPTQPLTITAPGYVTFTWSLELSTTDFTAYTAELDPADPNETGTLTGTVRSTTGTPIVSALVKFLHVGPGGTTEVRAYTDSSGNYVIGGVPIGVNSVSAEAAGYITSADQTTVVADVGGTNAPLDFSLLPGTTRITVGGTVVDAFSGSGVVGATVTLGEAGSQTTGAGGAFTFTDVLVGSQSVDVTAFGFDPYNRTINVLPGMAALRLALTPSEPEPPGGPYNLQGKVTLSGRPDNAGATVTAFNSTTNAQTAQVITPASGEYTMFLPPGEYRITASYGGQTLPRTETVPGGGRILRGIDFLL